jgi:hypothetical protein
MSAGSAEVAEHNQDSSWPGLLADHAAGDEARADNGAWLQPGSQRVKTYDIEVQRLKSMRHDKGLFEVRLDALVVARHVRDDDSDGSCLRIPVEHARTLLHLLKQNLAELDKLQPRSRRSGRA